MDMKPDTIVLFVNDKEGNEKRPDLTGTALWNGEEINALYEWFDAYHKRQFTPTKDSLIL